MLSFSARNDMTSPSRYPRPTDGFKIPLLISYSDRNPFTYALYKPPLSINAIATLTGFPSARVKSCAKKSRICSKMILCDGSP